MKVNAEQIVKTLKVINTLFPHNKYEVSKDLVGIWLTFFGDYEQELFTKAFRKAVANSQFVPTIATIITEAKKLMAATLPSGETAWQRLIDAFPARRMHYTEYGYECDYSSCDKEAIALLPPLAIEAFKAIGGWDEIAQAKTDEMEWVRKRFVKEYAERSAVEIERALEGTGQLIAAPDAPALTDGEHNGKPQAAAASLAERWRN